MNRPIMHLLLHVFTRDGLSRFKADVTKTMNDAAVSEI